MTIALRLFVVALLAVGCTTTATPTTTPLDHRRVHLITFDAERQLLVIDESELITDVVRADPPGATTQPTFTATDVPAQVIVSWISGPCDQRQSMIVKGTGDGVSVDIYNGPQPADVGCPDLAIANAVRLTFFGAAPPLTGQTHRGSPPQ